MNAEQIYEQLKKHVRDDLYAVHTAGGVCPKCDVDDSSTWKGCPVIDEYMVERIINTCNAGLQGMTTAAQRTGM